MDDDDTYQNQICHSMMGTFLIKSITPALCQRIQAKKDQWFYIEHNALNGLILFKILISYGSIGSHAGIDKNKSKLQHLKLVAYEHDMIKLMDDFEATLVQIQSKGEQFSNHTLCLFKAFETSHDPIFNNYIQTFKDKWNDGEDINWTVLADKAIQRYKALCEAGIWKSADAKKKQIMVLTSAIQSMTKVIGHTPHPKKTQDGPKNAVRGAPEYAAWKSIPPTTDEPNKMQKGTRSYYWCLNHGSAGMWVAHKPADTKAIIKRKQKGPMEMRRRMA